MSVTSIKKRLIDNPVVGRTPNLLIKLFYYLYMFTTILSAEIFIGQAWEAKYNWFGFNIIGSYYLIFSINLLLGLFITFLSQYYLRCKLNYKLICYESLCLIGILVSSLSFPSHFVYADKWFESNEPAFVYDLLTIDRIHYLLSSILLLLFFYVSFTYIPKINKKISSKGFYKVIIAICLISIIYSLIAEFNIYKEIFKGNDALWEKETIKSFFGHKNVYGLFLLFGIISSLFLEHYERKSRYFLISIILYIATIFSVCKTSVLVGFILLIFYQLFALLSSLKDKNRRNRYFIIISTLLVSFLLLFFIPNPISNVIKVNFNRIFKWVFDSNGGTLNTRKLIQERIFTLIINNPVFYMFGIGNYQFNFVCYFSADVKEINVWQPHSGFLMALGEGGIIRFSIYILLTFYLLKILITKIFKERNKTAILLLAFLFIFEIRSMVEPEYFLSGSWASIIFLYLICLPILTLGEKDYEIETFVLKEKDVNLINRLFLYSPTVIAVGFIINTIWLSIPLVVIGVIMQSIGFNLNKNKTVQRVLSMYVLSLELILFITAFILKVLNVVNLATIIEFAIYAFVFNISSLYIFMNLGLIKLSFTSWTYLENRIVEKENK